MVIKIKRYIKIYISTLKEIIVSKEKNHVFNNEELLQEMNTKLLKRYNLKNVRSLSHIIRQQHIFKVVKIQKKHFTQYIFKKR